MAIYAHERVRGVLVGEYGSVFKGRSMDFDDLREYIPGDDIKDIDWKATARSGATRIRRYIAVRKHNIMLVIDTGRNMTAVTDSGSSKKDTVIMLAGVIGTVALKHGDLVGMVSGDKGHSRYHPLKTGMTHLERLLQVIDTSVVDESDESNIASQLEYVVRNVRRKMIVVVISDEIEFDESVRSVVRGYAHSTNLAARSDADLTCARFADVEQIGHILPAFIRRNKTVMAAFRREEAENRQKFERELNRMAIATETVSSEEEAVPKVFRLLERHRSARYT